MLQKPSFRIPDYLGSFYTFAGTSSFFRSTYIPIELVLDHIEKEHTTIAIVLIFILRFVGVVLLIEVVLWRVGVVLSSDPRQVCLITSVDIVDIKINASFDIVDIGISVCWFGVGVSFFLLVLYIEAALDV